MIIPVAIDFQRAFNPAWITNFPNSIQLWSRKNQISKVAGVFSRSTMYKYKKKWNGYYQCKCKQKAFLEGGEMNVFTAF